MRKFLTMTGISTLFFTSTTLLAGIDDFIDDQDWIPKFQLVSNNQNDQTNKQENGDQASQNEENCSDQESTSQNKQNCNDQESTPQNGEDDGEENSASQDESQDWSDETGSDDEE